MHFTSIHLLTLISWSQVEKLILPLLREVDKSWPLRFDLIRWLSETTTLIATLVKTCVTSLVRALSLLLPLLSFPGHLRSLHLFAFFLLVLISKFACMHTRALHVLVTTTIVTLLVFSCLLLLDYTELRVLSCGNQIRLSNSSSLFLLLHQCLSGRDKGRDLSGGEITKLAKSLLLVVGFEQFTVKLVFKVKGRASWTKSSAFKVDAKRP